MIPFLENLLVPRLSYMLYQSSPYNSVQGMDILYTVWDGQKPEMSEHMHCLGENSCQLYGILVKEKCCFCDIFILSNNQLLHRERSVWHVVNTK